MDEDGGYSFRASMSSHPRTYPGYQIIIKKLPLECDEESLGTLLEVYGEVEELKFKQHHYTSYAWVDGENREVRKNFALVRFKLNFAADLLISNNERFNDERLNMRYTHEYVRYMVENW